MEIREIITFLTVADLKSFSQAAKQLGYTQSAVTLQIKRLENNLHASLFNRMNNKISLTDQGERFYISAQTIVNAFKDAVDTINTPTEIKGTLTIGTIESLCYSVFPSIINRFHQLYPHVNINVIIGSPTNLLKDMDNNLIDLVYFMDERRYSTNWVQVLEAPEEIIFATPTNNALVKKNKHSLADLAQLPFILTEKDASYRNLLDQQLATNKLSITPFLESESTSFLLKVLLSSQALTFLPRFTLKEYLRDKTLREVKVKDFSLSIWRQVVYNKNHHLSKPMQALFTLIAEQEKE